MIIMLPFTEYLHFHLILTKTYSSNGIIPILQITKLKLNTDKFS